MDRSDITSTLTARLSKQVQNLKDQLKASRDLHEKTVIDANTNHAAQLETLKKKLKSFEELSSKIIEEKASLYEKTNDYPRLGAN